MSIIELIQSLSLGMKILFSIGLGIAILCILCYFQVWLNKRDDPYKLNELVRPAIPLPKKFNTDETPLIGLVTKPSINLNWEGVPTQIHGQKYIDYTGGRK